MGYILQLHPGGQLVICWGEGDHLTIEFATEDTHECAHTNWQCALSDLPYRIQNAEDPCVCDPCVDIPLTIENASDWYSRSLRNPDLKIDVPNLSLVSVAALDNRPFIRNLIERITWSDASLTLVQLRTTHLLI